MNEELQPVYIVTRRVTAHLDAVADLMQVDEPDLDLLASAARQAAEDAVRVCEQLKELANHG